MTLALRQGVPRRLRAARDPDGHSVHRHLQLPAVADALRARPLGWRRSRPSCSAARSSSSPSRPCPGRWDVVGAAIALVLANVVNAGAMMVQLRGEHRRVRRRSRPRAPLLRTPALFTSRSSSTRVVSRLSMRSSGQALGPSDFAFAGSGCVSMNRPATPVATAARASTGTNSRWPPELVPCPPGKLDAVGRVEHHRATGLAHDRQAAHVADEVVVAERGAALAHHDRLFVDAGRLGGAPRLVDDIRHVVRRHELRLLDVHRLARGGDRMDEVGLPREEGRRLQARRRPPRPARSAGCRARR